MLKTLFAGLLALAVFQAHAATEGQTTVRRKKVVLSEETDDGVSSNLGKNAISGELLGRAGAYGVFFDRMIADQAALGIGFTSYGHADETSSIRLTVIPVYANYYFQPDSHRGFITGGADIARTSFTHTRDVSRTEIFGHTYTGSTGTDTSILPVLGGGYEYRSTGGFLFRGTVYEIFAQKAFTWFGLSFGAAF